MPEFGSAKEFDELFAVGYAASHLTGLCLALLCVILSQDSPLMGQSSAGLAAVFAAVRLVGCQPGTHLTGF